MAAVHADLAVSAHARQPRKAQHATHLELAKVACLVPLTDVGSRHDRIKQIPPSEDRSGKLVFGGDKAWLADASLNKPRAKR